MPDQPTASPLTPEIVNAIVRDPDDPRYPVQVGVFCDRCGTTVKRDYLVSDDTDRQERFEVARGYLREHEGWSCTEAGDFCPECASGDASHEGPGPMGELTRHKGARAACSYPDCAESAR
jgi:hypothetical protein